MEPITPIRSFNFKSRAIERMSVRDADRKSEDDLKQSAELVRAGP
jgi:hypothetical protein